LKKRLAYLAILASKTDRETLSSRSLTLRNPVTDSSRIRDMKIALGRARERIHSNVNRITSCEHQSASATRSRLQYAGSFVGRIASKDRKVETRKSRDLTAPLKKGNPVRQNENRHSLPLRDTHVSPRSGEDREFAAQ